MGCGSSKVEGESKALMKSNDKRKCRDILCVGLFAAFWVGMVFVFAQGLTYGDPWKLVCGTDHGGNVCGSTDGLCVSTDGLSLTAGNCGKYITYPRMDDDLYILASTATIPFNPTPDEVLNFPYYGVCRESCPQRGEWVCNQATVVELNKKFGVAAGFKDDSDLLSEDSLAELEACKQEKDGLSYWSSLSARCEPLMEGCSKTFVVENDLFFRCIPATDENTTCAESPYLESIGEDVETMLSIKEDADGNKLRVQRPAASSKHCGVCLDPVLDERGNPTDPALFDEQEGCKAVQIKGIGVQSKAQVNPVFEELNTWTAQLRLWMSDLQQTWWQITVSGVVGAIIIGIVWLILLYYFAKVFVYVAVWGFFLLWCGLTLALMLAGGVITTDMLSDAVSAVNDITGEATVDSEDASAAVNTIQQANIFGEQAAETQAMYEILAWISLVMTVVTLVIIFAMWSRIKIAVQVIKEGTMAIRAMPMMLLFPLNTVVCTVLLAGYWVYGAMLISSSSELSSMQLGNFSINASAIVDVADTVTRRRTFSPVEQAVAGVGAGTRRLLGHTEGWASYGGYDVPYEAVHTASASSAEVPLLGEALTLTLGEAGAAADANYGYGGRMLNDNETNATSAPVAAPVAPDPTSAPSAPFGEVLSQVGGVAVEQLVNIDLQQGFWLYHFFGFLWTNQVIQAVGICTIAGSTATWYYAHPTDKRANLPAAPVLAALKRCFRFHFGSLIFGACVIAIVQFVRFLLAYLDRQTKGLQEKNIVVKIFMKVVQCCLWCFEKIVKFISKNAYIMVAIHGEGFCASTVKAVSVLIANAARIGAAAFVSMLVIVMGRLFIVCGAGALCWFLVDVTTTDSDDYDISSDMVPALCAALVSWFVSGCFMEVYGVAIDTIMICFCEDDNYNDGTAEKPYYMSKGLLKIVGKKNAKSGPTPHAAAGESSDDGADESGQVVET